MERTLTKIYTEPTDSTELSDYTDITDSPTHLSSIALAKEDQPIYPPKLRNAERRRTDLACTKPIVNDSDLDFRPELIGNHYKELLEKGLSRSEAKDTATVIAQRELTTMFLERYCHERLVHYTYMFDGDDMLSPGYEHLGDVTLRFQRAVEEKELLGQNSSREQAELEGIEKIKRQKGDSLTISRPTDCDYNFYYLGKYDSENQRIDMFAWRNHKNPELQVLEANSILGEAHYSPEVTSNDLLQNPIFAEFNSFAQNIDDFPPQEKFEEAKKEDMGRYAGQIYKHACMLTDLIESNATIPTLRAAQQRIEMDFSKWVKGEEVKATESTYQYSQLENHARLREDVYSDLGRFVMMGYKDEKYSCGSCGMSSLSLAGINTDLSSPFSQILNSSPELTPSYIPCPNCGESLRLGSSKCSSCGMSKKEFDGKKTGNR